MSNSFNEASSNNQQLCDSWEDLDDIGISSSVKQLRKENLPQPAQQSDFPSVVIMPNDDEFRPKILQRPIQILKRPTSSQAAALAQQAPEKPQIKTYEQREKEYKEARTRIMGSATEDTEEAASSKNLYKPKVNGFQSSPTSSSNNLQPSSPKPPENVIRLPKGPDGSPGFMKR